MSYLKEILVQTDWPVLLSLECMVRANKNIHMLIQKKSLKMTKIFFIYKVMKHNFCYYKMVVLASLKSLQVPEVNCA